MDERIDTHEPRHAPPDDQQARRAEERGRARSRKALPGQPAEGGEARRVPTPKASMMAAPEAALPDTSAAVSTL